MVLTALAAILAMIPLARSVFWGPMAVSMMGGFSGRNYSDARVLPGPLRGLVQGSRAGRHRNGSASHFSGWGARVHRPNRSEEDVS